MEQKSGRNLVAAGGVMRYSIALLAVLVVGDFVLERSDSLVRREHVHSEVHTEPVATTTTYFAVSGALTMRADMWTRDSPAQPFATGHPVKYAVENLPPGDEASIALFRGNWRILRRINGALDKDWSGSFATPKEALEILEAEYRRPCGIKLA